MPRSRAPVVLALLATLLLLTSLAPLPAGAEAAVPRALGTLTEQGPGDEGCIPGWSCTKFEVTCPGLAGARTGYLAESPAPSSAVRGMLVTFSGGAGTGYWSGEGPDKADMVRRLHEQHGMAVVQVRWAANWQAATSGERAGPPAVACRPATALRHVYDTLYAPLRLPASPGVCGFCTTGGSGGSAQVAYTISHYGLDEILQGAFPISGPTHAAIAKGCRRDVRIEEQYWFSGGDNIDEAYGYLQVKGPCALRDASWASTWERDSVDAPEADAYHPFTRVHLVLGQTDLPQRARAEDYVLRLARGGSPMVAVDVVAGMGHALTSQGVLRLEAALLRTASQPMTACANGLDDDADGLVDFGAGADPGCSGATDLSERVLTAGAVCDDDQDTDGDGRRSAGSDAGCSGPNDTSELSPSAACDNGLDDDGDGRTDFATDRGCSSITDTAGTGSPERDSGRPCDNGLDDDGDGRADHRVDGTGDPQCTSPDTASETGGTSGGSSITISTKTVTEGGPGSQTSCRVTLSLTPASSGRVTVGYTLADGEATAPSDYVAASGTAKFAAGKTKSAISVVVNGDAIAEPAEDVVIRLSNPTGATLGNSVGTCWISNDD